MASSPSEDTDINGFLRESGLYLSSAHWFQLLQDEGTDMSADEKNLCYEQPKKRWTRKVAHVDKFYPKLYNLASEVYDRLQKHSQFFPNLGKNKTSAIHSIGKLIANRRTLKSRADIHSLPLGDESEGVQFTRDPQYTHRNEFYFLSQREVLLFCHQILPYHVGPEEKFLFG